MCMYNIDMEASGICAAVQSDRLLLWKKEQAKGLILEGDSGGYDDDDADDEDATTNGRTVKRLCKVCHAG